MPEKNLFEPSTKEEIGNNNIKARTSISKLMGSLLTEKYLEEEWLDEFSFYADSNERIMYNEISHLIYRIDSEKYELIQTRIDGLFRIVATRNTSKGNNMIKMFNRFYDHCSLAVSQRKLLDANSEAIDKKIQNSSKEMIGQFIGLISLFTALSFVTFGGINMLGGIVESVKDLDIGYTLIVGAVWFACMSAIFFIFMHYILKVIGKDGIISWKIPAGIVLAEFLGLVLLANII